MRWVVGDIQGCARELEDLLDVIRFDRSRDELWSVGDLINRGPDSLEVVRIWRENGGRGVIGNHEVAALLAHSGARPKHLPTLRSLFEAPDSTDLMAALRALPAMTYLPSSGDGPDAWIVHAGLHPEWIDLEATAAAIESTGHDDAWLRSKPVRHAVNVRCCTPKGKRSEHPGPPSECAPPYRPWDEYYRGETLVVHGHWSARGYYRGDRTMGLDSGCVWGGKLTAWCQEEDRIVQVPSSGSLVRR